MARGGGIDDLAYYGILAAVAYGGYKFALEGKLGTAAQQAALEIHKAINPNAPAAGIGSGGTTGGSSTAAACRAAATGNLAAMIAAADPTGATTFITDMRDWKRQTGNSNDWARFRQHRIDLQAVDPGPNPPPEFCS